MVNICIDGNYIFHKTFGVFAGYSGIDPGKTLSDKKDRSLFIRKIATDLCSSLRDLPTGGRLIFTADSRSWRKKIEIEDGGYKSDRVKDEKVDWTIFFDLLQEFGKHLEKMGFIYSKVEGAEGDDLLLYWCDYFNSIGENCFIISGDKDLYQLVTIKNNAWTCTWNTNSKRNILSIPKGWKESWLENKSEASIFNTTDFIDSDKEKMSNLLNKIELIEIEDKKFIFNKVLVGDKGDCVPSVWNIKKGERTQTFSQKKADIIMESFIESEWYTKEIIDVIEDPEFLNWISGFILRTSKDVDSSENREKVIKNLIRNFNLMWLNSEMIPEYVTQEMEKEIIRGTEMPKRNITIDRIKILEGTEWISVDQTPKQFDPFSLFNS
jgi:5'-3' exonuclease